MALNIRSCSKDFDLTMLIWVDCKCRKQRSAWMLAKIGERGYA